MKAPAFQFYAGDFFVDTVTWDLDELGLYTRLLSIEWANGPLPNDPKRLAKIAGTSLKKFNYLFEMVASKFIQDGNGFLINVRLEETRAEQLQYAEKQREKGKKSAEKRWGNKVTTVITTVQPDDKPKGNPPSSSSSSTSLKDKKPIAEVPKKSTSPEHKEFVKYAFDTFQDSFGEKMMFDGGKDGAIVKKLLGTYGLERLKGLWDQFMQSDDEFLQESGYSIGVFKTQINKLISAKTMAAGGW